VGPSAQRLDARFPPCLLVNAFPVLAKCAELKNISLEDCPDLPSWRLLISGFLTDGDIFRSFGFEKLYEDGYLTFEHWKAFQHRQFEIDITLLEDLFSSDGEKGSIDEDELMQDNLRHREEVGQRVSFDQEPLLVDAAEVGDEQSIRRLLDKGADVNQTDWESWTPLFTAARYGHEDIVQLLLKHNAAVDLAENEGWTPLKTAARYGHEGIVQLLLKHNAAVDLADNKGWTPLLTAARYGHEGIVQLLLAHGAIIHHVDIDGWTSLHLAALGGHHRIIQLLRQHGANYSGSTFWGVTAKFSARKNILLNLQRFKKLEESSIHPRQDMRRHATTKMARPIFEKQREAVLALDQNEAAFVTLRAHFSSTAKAWQRGFASVRQLSRGFVPHEFADVVALLCLCRALSEVLDFHTDSSHQQKFKDDLGRWCLLLDDKEKDAYKKLALKLWEVDIDHSPSRPCGSVDEDLLEYARSLVSSLVQETRDFFCAGATDHLGLEQSQHRWRERRGVLQMDASVPAIVEPKPPDDGSEKHTDHRGWNSIYDHALSLSSPVGKLLVLVVTGAIFVGLLVFLVCKFIRWPWSCIKGSSTCLVSDRLPGLRSGGVGGRATRIIGLGRKVQTLASGARSAQVLLSCCQVLEAYLGLGSKDLGYHRGRSASSTDFIMSGMSENFQVSPTASAVSSGLSHNDSSADDPESFSSVDIDSSPSSTGVVTNVSLRTSPVEQPEENGGAGRTKCCQKCDRNFSSRTNYLRHLRDKHNGNRYACQACGKTYSRKDYMKTSHVCRVHHGIRNFRPAIRSAASRG
jgi:hypothetical protein